MNECGRTWLHNSAGRSRPNSRLISPSNELSSRLYLPPLYHHNHKLCHLPAWPSPNSGLATPLNCLYPWKRRGFANWHRKQPVFAIQIDFLRILIEGGPLMVNVTTRGMTSCRVNELWAGKSIHPDSVTHIQVERYRRPTNSQAICLKFRLLKALCAVHSTSKTLHCFSDYRSGYDAAAQSVLTPYNTCSEFPYRHMKMFLFILSGDKGISSLHSFWR